MKKRDAPPVIEEKTLSRRSVLDWMGKATVLALGGELFCACDGDGAKNSAPGSDATKKGNDPGAALDGGAPVGNRDTDTGADTSTGIGIGNDTDPDTESNLDSGIEVDTEHGSYVYGDFESDSETVDGGQEADFQFTPGQGKQDAFEWWKENTVDQQDLMRILENWELRVDGLVEEPLVLRFAELLELERRDQATDFHCVEGWSVYSVPWNGVHMSTLFDMVGPAAEATHVTFHTQGNGYNESLPIEVALEQNTMLAYGIAGSTIPLKHGFPLRLVVPRMLGYKSAKYVYRIELDNKPVEGYWVQAGYPYDAPVPEGRLRPGKY